MSKPVRRGRLLVMTACLVVLGAIATAGGMVFQQGDGPRAEWRFGPDRQTVEPFDEVPIADPMTLEVSLPFEAWVYTVYFSLTDGCRAMFPSDYLATDLSNPLPPGTHRLPGKLDGKEMDWVVPGQKSQVVSFMVVVSKKPLPGLRKRMRTFFQIGNTAFVDRTFGSYLPKGGKTVLPKENRIYHPILEQAAYDRDAAMDGPMIEMRNRPGVFMKAMHVIPKDPRRSGG
jgi:hypothetical protein